VRIDHDESANHEEEVHTVATGGEDILPKSVEHRDMHGEDHHGRESPCGVNSRKSRSGVHLFVSGADDRKEHPLKLHFLDQHRLSGRGLGWTDVHLLAASALSRCSLWSLDRRLHDAGRRLRLAFRA
jgi:hypothetical protein